jgi:geranylgeranyl diphosphate synthase, type II
MESKIETVNLLELLSANKRQVDKIILNFLPDRHRNEEISTLYTMMRDYPARGGKGLRGSICLLWCELFGGLKKNALITASALELFQNWILIHDDIEDESDLRRGLPALHKKYGTPLAINVGDALHGKMWELLLKNNEEVGREQTLMILREFSTMLNETTEGQQMELSWTANSKWDIDEDDYFLMVTKKAAWYTCISPARMGMILGSPRASRLMSELLDRTVKMGTDVGISFQIIDDVLNLVADQKKYGKEILGDIFEGKRTLMVIHLLKNSSSSEREKIICILSKPRSQKSRDDAQFVFERMRTLGSIEYARSVAKKYSKAALREFDAIMSESDLEGSEQAKITRSLIEYMTERDY